MTPDCDHCEGSGKLPAHQQDKELSCPECNGSGTAKPAPFVRHYVATAHRGTSGNHVTRALFASFVSLVCFVVSYNIAGVEAWQSAFMAMIMAVVGFAISFACPVLLSMFRWFIAIGIIVIGGYLAAAVLFQ